MAEDESSVAQLTETVRQVLRKRVADPHLIEDLTQETLVSVVAARPRLGDDALRAYAIVTARNALIHHYRRQATGRRHAHRLVDYRGLAGPEQLTLERAETDALARALDQLDPEDRDLLIAHEAEGEPLETLAERDHTTTRTIASRLARARAQLRVEFLLAFRNVGPITSQCRNNLMALSSGDRRRQRELGTEEHVRTCVTCSALSKPIVERRRGIAAWLILPFAALLYKFLRSLRTSRVTQALAMATVAVTATGTLVATRPGPSSQELRITSGSAPATAVQTQAPGTTVPVSAPAAPTEQTQAPGTTVPVSTPAAPTEQTQAPGATVAEGNPAAITVPAVIVSPTIAVPSLDVVVTAVPDIARPAVTSVLPNTCAAAVDLGAIDAVLDGCPFELAGMVVLEVPADEGFWIMAPDGAPVWVHLVGPSESPQAVEADDVVTLHGVQRATTADPDNTGAPSDQMPRILQRNVHLEVPYEGLVVEVD